MGVAIVTLDPNPERHLTECAECGHLRHLAAECHTCRVLAGVDRVAAEQAGTVWRAKAQAAVTSWRTHGPTVEDVAREWADGDPLPLCVVDDCTSPRLARRTICQLHRSRQIAQAKRRRAAGFVAVEVERVGRHAGGAA